MLPQLEPFLLVVTAFSDCRHVNKREVEAFPINLEALASCPDKKVIRKLAKELMDDLF